MNEVNMTVRRRVKSLTWLLPLAMALLFVLFQVGPARWLQDNGLVSNRNLAATMSYAMVVTVMVFLVFRQIGIWLGETNQSQSQVETDAERLAQITNTSADAILSLDSQGVIDTWNSGAHRLFGFEAAMAQGHPFSDLLGGGEAAQVENRWLCDEVRQRGFVRGHETTCLAADGRRVEVEATITLLKSDNGRPAGMSVVLRDITRRRHREEETQRLNAKLNRQAAERNSELGVKVRELGQANSELQKLDQTRSEFVSLVSHQIRAPLTNMGGAVQRMQSDCTEINPTCARMFTIFEQQVDRLDRLVQDVLNASHLEAGEVSLQLEPISVLPVVRQAAAEIRAGTPGRAIHFADKPGLPLAYADRDRVAEVLANLLDNADKYSPLGKEIAVQLRADQTEVTVAVRDAGPGIPPQDLERIFDKFYRTDSSDAQTAYGYGLGLYVCRQLMEAQGGRIWAENQPDGGTLFSFALPVWQEKNE
jgi:PAS domain S-box-containing protein